VPQLRLHQRLQLVNHDDGKPLREFLYVDVDRARSMLAQLDHGLVVSVVERSAVNLGGKAEATIFGIGGGINSVKETATETSRSLQDLTFGIFEEAAIEQGLVTELGDEYADPENWSTGAVHASVLPGQIVRMRAPVQILDPEFFRRRVTNLESLATHLVGVTQPDAFNGLSKTQREAR